MAEAVLPGGASVWRCAAGHGSWLGWDSIAFLVPDGAAARRVADAAAAQAQPTGLACPRCELPLARAELAEAEAFACRPCRGWWVDAAGRERLREAMRRAGRLHAAAEEAWRAAGEPAPAAGAPHDPGAFRRYAYLFMGAVSGVGALLAYFAAPDPMFAGNPTAAIDPLGIVWLLGNSPFLVFAGIAAVLGALSIGCFVAAYAPPEWFRGAQR
jgi:Zn-finger nucleic acid-binding protein